MKNFTKTLACSLAMFLTSQIFAQTDLPHFATPQENLGNFNPPTASGITDPPNFPVRAMAEWEELQALNITWTNSTNFNTILSEIVRAARLECKVVINCNTQSVIDNAKSFLTGKNVDITSNVDFVATQANSIWVRDYGPNCIYANDVDSLFIVDWIYNRNRPLDDAIPQKVANHLGLQMFETSKAPYDLVNTGGNFMTDGMGQAFASKLIFTNNDRIENGECGNLFDLFGTSDHTEATIDDVMKKFMGIERYIKLDQLPYDCIHHIDMHIKLLDEETLLVGEYPTGIADGPQIEANLQYILANVKNAFGKPYKVVRIPMPPEGTNYPNTGGDYRTYANAVFVNKTIIVPFYEQKYDTIARRIWETAMPGYKVVGINCNGIIPSLGAIHCITKEIGVRDPLRIVHEKLPDVPAGTPGYSAKAFVQHRSGIEKVKLFYTLDPTAGNWKSIEMTPGIIPSGEYFETIPQQPDGSTVYYYIEGTSTSGRSRNLPLPAPAGFFKFKVGKTSGSADLSNLILEKIYPNPSTGQTVVPVVLNQKAQVVARVFDVLGKMQVEFFNGELPSGKSNLFVDATQLSAGTYFVEIISGGRKNVGKLIVR